MDCESLEDDWKTIWLENWLECCNKSLAKLERPMKPCNCDRLPHKHGKDRQGFQRWKCPICGKTFSDNTQPKKAGRKSLNDRPMTDAERKRKQRSKNQENGTV